MLLLVILSILLLGNWLLTETLIYLPLKLAAGLTTFGGWGLLLVTVLFLAWCIGED